MQDLKPFVEKICTQMAITLSPEAHTYFLHKACEVPEQIFSELQKIALYGQSTTTVIEIKDLEQLSIFSDVLKIDHALKSFLLKDISALNQALPLTVLEDEEILVLRSFAKIIHQMLSLHLYLKANMTYDVAINQIVPSVFFEHKKIFEKVYNQWPIKLSLATLSRLQELEINIKTGSITTRDIKAALIQLMI